MKDAYSIIQRYLVTEQGTSLKEKENKYLFKVDPRANKLEIKRAIEQLFGVKVLSVNTMIRKGKKKRERTRNFGSTSDWHRAVVTLKEGESISLS